MKDEKEAAIKKLLTEQKELLGIPNLSLSVCMSLGEVGTKRLCTLVDNIINIKLTTSGYDSKAVSNIYFVLDVLSTNGGKLDKKYKPTVMSKLNKPTLLLLLGEAVTPLTPRQVEDVADTIINVCKLMCENDIKKTSKMFMPVGSQPLIQRDPDLSKGDGYVYEVHTVN